jgi:hypothetical protein
VKFECIFSKDIIHSMLAFGKRGVSFHFVLWFNRDLIVSAVTKTVFAKPTCSKASQVSNNDGSSKFGTRGLRKFSYGFILPSGNERVRKDIYHRHQCSLPEL